MIVTEQIQTFCPDPKYLKQVDADGYSAQQVGEFELFRPPGGVWCHKLAIIMDQYNPTGLVNSFNIEAEIHFDLDGKTITNYPAVFSTDRTTEMRSCLFPNTNNVLGLGSDAVQLYDWLGTPIFLIPRRIVSAADRITLLVKKKRVATGCYGWHGYFHLISANKFF